MKACQLIGGALVDLGIFELVNINLINEIYFQKE